MNFKEDLRLIILQELNGVGYSPKNKELRNALRILLNIRDKTISMSKRKVYISKELQSKELEEPYAESLKVIQKKFEKGQNINPYLSKCIMAVEKSDALLYDWGIHHLHLNLKFDENDFIERSDYLLFFMLKDSEVFFIDVTPHKMKNNTTFVQHHLVHLLWDNWDYLLTPYRLEGVLGTAEGWKDEQYKKLRKSNSNGLIEYRGNVFSGAGGGLLCNEDRFTHTMAIDYIVGSLTQEEDRLKNQMKIINKERTYLNLIPIQNNFALIYDKEMLYVIEKNSGNLISEVDGELIDAFASLKNLHFKNK